MHTPTWLPRLGLAALCTLAACAGGDPSGPSDPDDPDGPGPTIEPRWDITITPRFVRGSSSKTCDGDGLFGAEDPGEYQFRINALFGSTSRSYETNHYGSVTGANMPLKANEVGNFTNQNWTFSDLKAGQAVSLRMWVTEWDLTSKDSYMNNRSTLIGVTPSSLRPTGGTAQDRELSVGMATCGLILFYDAAITRRDVTVN